MSEGFLKAISSKTPRNYFSEIEKVYGVSGLAVFLMNPRWSTEQKTAAETLIHRFLERSREGKIAPAPHGRIFIASGGSGGKIRFVAHTPQTFEASARALCEVILPKKNVPLNCFSCLPAWHVSGFMPFVRARVSGGKFFVAKSGSFHDECDLVDFRRGNADEFWMNSLVPTQLKRIFDLRGGADWLRQFDFILLGGAAVAPKLVERALAENLKIGIGYGMTETASLVALWRAGEISPKERGSLFEIFDGNFAPAGKPLPHAKIFVRKEDSRIEIEAKSLGETLSDEGELLPNPDGKFLTNDEGSLDFGGRIRVLGRADRYIISGGEKIDPVFVENAFRRAGVVDVPIIVVGEPDADWGERVVALVCRTTGIPENLNLRLREILPATMIPKRIVLLPKWAPRVLFDEKGKINRAALQLVLSM